MYGSQSTQSPCVWVDKVLGGGWGGDPVTKTKKSLEGFANPGGSCQVPVIIPSDICSRNETAIKRGEGVLRLVFLSATKS